MGWFGALEAEDPRQVGRYRIVARLGAGGMGRVYLGRSPGGRAVAVKVVRPELAEDEEFRRRFAREVAAARRVNGAFTAGVVDADPEQLTARPLGPACDVFALGAVLTFTATGVGPFDTGSAHALHFRTNAGVFRASPTVAGRAAYVGDTSNGLLYALDALTGEQWWKSDIGIVSGAPPVVYGGVVYFTTSGGHLYAVDANKGTTRWVFANGGGHSPAVTNGVVHVGSGGHLYAVDAATGTQRWMFPTGSRAFSSPAVSDGVVYVATSSDDKYLYAVDAVTGKQKWKLPTHEAASTPAVSDGLVYVSTWGRLYAVRV